MFANIEDLRRAARARVPRVFFDYVDGGAFSESTQRANTADFDLWALEQRVLVDLRKRDFRASYLGAEHALPFMIGPAGFAGLLAHRGEAQAARAAGAAGIPICQSTPSICTIEEVAAATRGSYCFQLYILKDRSLAESFMERAAGVKAQALFVTVDATLGGRRERDLRNGFFAAKRPSAKMLLDFARHPRWALDMARGPVPVFGNFPASFGKDIIAQAHAFVPQMDLSLTWKDLDWVRARWKGRLIVKGILSVAEAERALARGADGIVVSNHGGRQLDGARSSIAVLPDIAAAVGGRTEVLFDGGIRRGAHIVKALALGAKACLLGRAWLYGLGAAGEAGVARAIDLLKVEMDLTMAFMGVTSVAQLREEGPGLLIRRQA